MCAKIGRLATGTSGLGRVRVSGCNREPRPPAITIALRILAASDCSVEEARSLRMKLQHLASRSLLRTADSDPPTLLPPWPLRVLATTSHQDTELGITG